MSKSNISDILEVQRLISRLDRRGKRAILNDLMKLGLEEVNWGAKRKVKAACVVNEIVVDEDGTTSKVTTYEKGTD